MESKPLVDSPCFSEDEKEPATADNEGKPAENAERESQATQEITVPASTKSSEPEAPCTPLEPEVVVQCSGVHSINHDREFDGVV